jgi:hypothetical protein
MAQEIPVLPDGRIDLPAILPTWSKSGSLNPDRSGHVSLTGTILGKAWAARWTEGAPEALFDIEITSDGLSEQATWVVSLLLADFICLTRGRAPAESTWPDTARQVGSGWIARIGCTAEPRGPAG